MIKKERFFTCLFDNDGAPVAWVQWRGEWEAWGFSGIGIPAHKIATSRKRKPMDRIITNMAGGDN